VRWDALPTATLYRRFSQKDDIGRAVGLREVRWLLTRVDRQVDTTTDAGQQIEDLIVAVLTEVRGNPLLTRVLNTEPQAMLTVQGWPVLELGRDYLREFIQRLQSEDKLPAFDAEPVAEMVARMALSLVLTPETGIPVDDDQAMRRFIREHITLVFRLPPDAETLTLGWRGGRRSTRRKARIWLSRLLFLATQVFSDEELERLRRFPEIGRDELFRFFTLTPADVAFVDPGRGGGRRIGSACRWRCAQRFAEAQDLNEEVPCGLGVVAMQDRPDRDLRVVSHGSEGKSFVCSRGR